MNILAIKKSDQNIRSKKKKKTWESLLILAGTIAAIVLADVEKILTWEKLLKVLGILRKVWDNKRKLLRGPENLFYTGKNSLSEFKILRVSCFDQVPHCVKSVQIPSFVWSVFFRIRSEYGEIFRISPYSVQMQENTDQKKLRIWTLFTQY